MVGRMRPDTEQERTETSEHLGARESTAPKEIRPDRDEHRPY